MENYFELALSGIDQMPVGQVFELSETIAEWEHMPKGDPNTFGTEFSRRCRNGEIANVVQLIEKSPQNHMRYRKER